VKAFIDIKYDLFNYEEIIFLIDCFKKNKNLHINYDGRTTLELQGQVKDLIYSRYKPYIFDNLIDWTQIVLWPPNTYQDLHLDEREKNTTISSITYLNDDYQGGETVFKDHTIIKPKLGKTIFFSGRKLQHGVNKVLNKPRYTIATWYKK
jgi:hypothetical protein|tara:strand:+ start:105 stop:554 length:450 start_codon:yes stop_codon:yes gene_type:complete